MAAGVIVGEQTFVEDGLGSGHHCIDLKGVEQAAQLNGWAAVDEALDGFKVCVGDWFADEVPNDGAQLPFVMERQTVVDAVGPTIAAQQAVTRLAIGVVGYEIEQAELAKIVDGDAVFVHGEVVLAEVGVDERLDRTLAERANADRGRRNYRHPEGRSQPIHSHFALVEVGWEVPERSFTVTRLVDPLGRDLVAAGRVAGDGHQQGGVRAVGHTTLHLDLARFEQLDQGFGVVSEGSVVRRRVPDGSRLGHQMLSSDGGRHGRQDLPAGRTIGMEVDCFP